jgi:Na+-driven multidrug efflux pump
MLEFLSMGFGTWVIGANGPLLLGAVAVGYILLTVGLAGIIARRQSDRVEAVGLAAAIWPHAWLELFDSDPVMIETGAAYLRLVGPTFGFFGLGLSLYFASQGAGRLAWPLLSGFMRLVVAIGGGWLALRLTGSVHALFAALSVALVIYGASLAMAIRSGVWFARR